MISFNHRFGFFNALAFLIRMLMFSENQHKIAIAEVIIGVFQFKICARAGYFYEWFSVDKIMLFYLTQKPGHVSLGIN